MNDPNTLLAQAEPPKHDAPKGDHPATVKPDDHGPGAPDHAEVSPFVSLLGQLGDHHEISIGNIHLIHLPVILFDDGLHVYSSVESMEHHGAYKMDAKTHHIVNAQTGKAPALNMSVTSLVAFQWLAMALMMIVLIPMARKYKKNGVRPVKGFHNAIEAVIIYVRDQVVLPNTGDAGRGMLPIFMTIFFFILVMNLVGLVPGGHSSTGSLNVTAGLAIIAFFVIQGAAIKKNGIGAWLHHLTGGVPAWLWPIMVPVEVLGLFTKPFALCVRLFANMTAGHVILLSLIGLIFVSQVFIPVTIGFSLFINILELLVAFIQAYIFTMLTAVFTGIGMASHDDHGHEGHGTEHAAAH